VGVTHQQHLADRDGASRAAHSFWNVGMNAEVAEFTRAFQHFRTAALGARTS
jgi:hypothetical protein